MVGILSFLLGFSLFSGGRLLLVSGRVYFNHVLTESCEIDWLCYAATTFDEANCYLGYTFSGSKPYLIHKGNNYNSGQTIRSHQPWNSWNKRSSRVQFSPVWGQCHDFYCITFSGSDPPFIPWLIGLLILSIPTCWSLDLSIEVTGPRSHWHGSLLILGEFHNLRFL